MRSVASPADHSTAARATRAAVRSRDHFDATEAAGGSGSGTRLRIAGSVCR